MIFFKIIIGGITLEANMKYGPDKYGIIQNIGNRGNKLIIIVEPNLNTYSHELIIFLKPFTTKILRDKTWFTL